MGGRTFLKKIGVPCAGKYPILQEALNITMIQNQKTRKLEAEMKQISNP